MASQKIAKNTAFLLAASIGQKVLSFIYFTIVADAVGVLGSGKYFLATSFTTMFAVLIDLGLSNVLVREVAKNRQEAPRLLGAILVMKAIMIAVTVVCIAAAAALLGYRGELGVMIALATVVTILDSLHLVCYAVMRGEQNLRYEAIGVITGQIITITAGSIFLRLQLPLPFLIIALLLGSTWNVLWATSALYRKFGIIPQFFLDKKYIRHLAAITFPFALSGIFSRIYSSIDSVMLSKLADAAALGFYGLAYKIAFAFQFLPIAFAAAIYPAMSAYTKEDRSKLGSLLTASMEYLLLVVVPITAGVFALAKPLVIIIGGEKFIGTVEPLKILMASLVFAFLYWPAGSLLNACDRQAKNTKIMAATMVVNILVNAALIPQFGAQGAAYAALIGNMVLFLGAVWYANKEVHIDWRIMAIRSTMILFAGGVMAAAVRMLETRLPLIAVIAVGAIVYIGLLFLLRIVTRKEVEWLLGNILRRDTTPAQEPV